MIIYIVLCALCVMCQTLSFNSFASSCFSFRRQPLAVYRTECGGQLLLGRCTNLDSLADGPNIFKPEASQTEEKDVSFCKYSLVTILVSFVF